MDPNELPACSKAKRVRDLRDDRDINLHIEAGYKLLATVENREYGEIVSRVAWMGEGDPPRVRQSGLF